MVQCAWVRGGEQRRLLDSVRVLMSEHSEDFAVAQSFVLVTNVGVPASSLGSSVRYLVDRGCAWPYWVRPSWGRGWMRGRNCAGGCHRCLGCAILTSGLSLGCPDRSSLDRGAAQQLAAVFVTDGRVSASARSARYASLCGVDGPPEMGKTAIARMVGLAQLTAGSEAYECVRPEEVRQTGPATIRTRFLRSRFAELSSPDQPAWPADAASIIYTAPGDSRLDVARPLEALRCIGLVVVHERCNPPPELDQGSITPVARTPGKEELCGDTAQRDEWLVRSGERKGEIEAGRFADRGHVRQVGKQ